MNSIHTAAPRQSASVEQLASCIADRARTQMGQRNPCRLVIFGERAIAVRFDDEFDTADVQMHHAEGVSAAVAALIPMVRDRGLDPSADPLEIARSLDGVHLLASLAEQLQRNARERGEL